MGPDKTMLWARLTRALDNVLKKQRRIQELTDKLKEAEEETANAYREMDEVWIERDDIENHLNDSQLETMALEAKLEKSMFMSNLWIKGLLGLMTPEQRKQSFKVIARVIAAGFESKGWKLDEFEADTQQLEQCPNSEG